MEIALYPRPGGFLPGGFHGLAGELLGSALIVGGALFAAFPEAYATIFSAFYTAIMLVLCALIFRATAIEFRSKSSSPLWRGAWRLSGVGAGRI